MIHLNRRAALRTLGGGLLAAGSAGLPAQGLGAPPGASITVLYRRELTAQAPTRQDPAVQAAMLALEQAFGERGFRVLQPPPATLELLDRSADVVLTFEAEAGFCMLFSVYRDVRPLPASDAGIVEVRIAARVLVGPTIVTAEEGRGQMRADLSPATRAFGERRAFDLAAREAAATLVEATTRRLKALTPEQLAQYAQPVANVLPGGQVVASVQPSAQAPAPTPPAPASAAAPAVAFTPPKRRFALVVGVSNYQPLRQRLGAGISDLAGVAVDLRNIEGALKGLGFQGDQVRVLKDQAATSTAVREHLMTLASMVGPDDLVLVSFSAHGAPKEMGISGYGQPVLHDFRGPRDPDSLDFWQIQALVGHLPAGRVVLMVDTCHSGGVAKSTLTAKVGAAGVQVQAGTVGPEPQRLAAAAGSRHFAVMAAAQSQEISLEDGTSGGLFTSRMLKAMTTSRNEPLEALFRRVQADVIRDSRPICQRLGGCAVQTPLFAYAGRGNEIRL